MGRQKTVTLSLDDYQPSSGQVKTDLPDEHAHFEGSNFNVKFQMLYEVHGGYKSSSSADDASLLVMKMIPSSSDPKEHLISFKITLTVLPDEQQQGSSVDWSQAPIITSYEPISSGVQHIKVLTTNETLEHAFEGTLQFEGFGVSPGVKGSRTRRTEYEKDHVLKIESGSQRTGLIPVRKHNTVWWRIQAADVKGSGIGDSFTVALLIRRAPASSFNLQATVDAGIGNLTAKLKEFVPSGWRSRKLPTTIGRYGPRTGEESTEVPDGIDRQNLSAASKNNVIRGLKEIGLHLSEEARPVKLGDAVESDKALPGPALSDPPTLAYPTMPQVQAVAQRESNLARMQRHRKMAALYERLAELHREEARQYLPGDEVAYARQVEDGLAD